MKELVSSQLVKTLSIFSGLITLKDKTFVVAASPLQPPTMFFLSILSTQNLFYLDLSLSLVKPQSKHYKSLPLQIANACLISQNARTAYLAVKEAYQIAHQSNNSFLPFS